MGWFGKLFGKGGPRKPPAWARDAFGTDGAQFDAFVAVVLEVLADAGEGASEMDVRTHELALQLLGPDAERMDGRRRHWVDGFLFSLSGPIYAGTNEIQRNIIADRVLNLPRG